MPRNSKAKRKRTIIMWQSTQCQGVRTHDNSREKNKAYCLLSMTVTEHSVTYTTHTGNRGTEWCHSLLTCHIACVTIDWLLSHKAAVRAVLHQFSPQVEAWRAFKLLLLHSSKYCWVCDYLRAWQDTRSIFDFNVTTLVIRLSQETCFAMWVMFVGF